jgi:hypothetical protein
MQLPDSPAEYGGALDAYIPKLVSLAGRTLQVIVKFANIILTPDNPKYPGGIWHVEGSLVAPAWELKDLLHIIQACLTNILSRRSSITMTRTISAAVRSTSAKPRNLRRRTTKVVYSAVIEYSSSCQRGCLRARSWCARNEGWPLYSIPELIPAPSTISPYRRGSIS